MTLATARLASAVSRHPNSSELHWRSLTVGTHRPYSTPEDYLQRYDTPKQAAVE